MRLKEFFEDVGNVGKKFGVVTFGTDIFREIEMTPHEEMRRSMELFEKRPLINSGIRQLTRFIIGNEINVVDDDERSKVFIQKWLDQRKMLLINIENALVPALLTGNAYIEEVWGKTADGRKVFDGIEPFPDPSMIYINIWDDAKPNEYYLVRVPYTVSVYNGQNTSMRQISYFYNNRVWKESVVSVVYPKNKFHHLKMGYSRNSLYGRSYISSVIDDATVVGEILKNIAIISRYRALNNKIIMPAGEQEEILEDDLVYNKQKFIEARDGSHIFMNKRMEIQSFSNTNEYDTLVNELEFLRKEISSGLVPNFITPFNSEVNRATAQEAKIPFLLEIEYLQTIFEQFFSKIIIDGLYKTYPGVVNAKAKLKFGNVDMEARQDKVNYMNQMYSAGVVTLNEYRKAAGLEPIDGGDKYAWEIQSPEQSGMTILNSTSSEAQKVLIESFIEGEDVWKELIDLNSSINQYMKKFGIGYNIKTFKDEKGASASFRKILRDLLSKDKVPSPSELQTEIKKKIVDYDDGKPNITDYEVERIARTEASMMRETTKLLRWKEMGFKKVKHNTIVRPNSGKLDKEFNGKVFDIDRLLKQEQNRIPLHPNCRCYYTLAD